MNPGELLHGFVAAVAVTVGALESVTVPLVIVIGWVLWVTRPKDEVMTKRPAPATELVGLTWTALTWLSPDETLIVGRLNPGALDHGLVAAVEVIVPLVTETNPLVIVTGPVAVTVGTPLIWTNPDEALRTVTVPEIWVSPAELRMTDVEVTVGIPLICISPDDALKTVTVPETVTGPVAVTVIWDESDTVPELMAVSTPADEVTGPSAAPAIEEVGVTDGHA